VAPASAVASYAPRVKLARHEMASKQARMESQGAVRYRSGKITPRHYMPTTAGPRSSKRHANADSPLVRRQRSMRYTVEPDRTQHQSKHAEQRGKRCDEPDPDWKLPATWHPSVRRSSTVRFGWMPASVWRTSAPHPAGTIEAKHNRVNNMELNFAALHPLFLVTGVWCVSGRRYTGRTGSRGLFNLKS